MNRLKRLAALLLACVLLVGAMPVPALATDAETCQHVYETAVTDPTCGQGGYTTYLCTLCGDTYEADYSDPLGGCTLEPIAQVDANCTSEGTAAHYQCRVCKNLYHDEEGMIPVEDPVELVLPRGSCAPEAVEKVDATCSAVGTAAHYECKTCGKLYLDETGTQEITDAATLVLPVGGCKPEAVAKVEATCTSEGTAAHYKCNSCGKLYMDEAGTQEITDAATLILPSGGCKPEAVAKVEATCTSEGTAAHYKCSSCGKLYMDEAGTQEITDAATLVLPVGSCKPEAVAKVEATCTSEGTAAYYKCSNCGKLYLDEAGTQEITDAATLVLPVGSCKPEAVAKVEATCTAEGTAAHYKCSSCGKLYMDEAGTQKVTDPAALEIPKLEHTFGNWEITTPATPTAEGVKTRACQVCGQTETMAVPKLKYGLSTPSVKITRDSASGKPYLTWGKVSKATAYRIYLVDTQTGEKTLLAETTARKYTYNDAQVGTRYTFTVVAVNATRCSKDSSKKTVICRCAKPRITVTSEPVSGKPIVSWQAVEGAVKYRVYRSTSSSSGFKKVAETTELSATITSSSANKTYYYRVLAVGPVSDSNSAYSAKIRHVCDCPQPVVTATSGKSKGIKISWKKASGAKKYYVYRASQEDGPYTRIAKTTSLSYTDTAAPANQISYYKVKAFNSAASLSAFSVPVSYMNHTFSAWMTVTPNTPEATGLKQRTCSVCGHVEDKITPKLKRSLSTPSVKIKQGSVSGKPYLSWAKVRSATAYQIYLVDTQTGEKTFLTETTAREYSYSQAEVGKSYTFTVVAVNSTRCSRYSAKKTILCRCPTPSIKMSSEPISGKPIVSWQAVEGAVSYRLYRATKKNGSFKQIAETTDLSIQVDSATANKTYYYRLQAVGSVSGCNSAYSDKVKHICDCAQPEISVTNGTVKGLQVSWKKVSGAKYYYVYRASEENGAYTYLKKTTSLSYTDTAAPENRVSYYKVRACGSSDSMSAYSAPVSCMNHTFGSWVVQRKSTPFEEGYRERACSGCDFVQGQTLPVLSRSLAKPDLYVSSANSNGRPVLSWDKVSKANEYWVYLYDSASDTYTFLTSTTSRSYIYQLAQPGTRCSFAVMAISDTACSDYSTIKTAMCRVPSAQLKISSDSQTGMPVLSWESVEGAAEYGIYRSAVSNTAYRLYTTTEACTLTITEETPGVQYYYRVQALHETEQEAGSVLSNVCHSPTAADTLQIHAGRASNKCNKVVWRPVNGAVAYHMYRSVSATSGFNKIAEVKGTEYTEIISSGKLYYYQVRAVDENGDTVGKWSNIDAAEETCQVPLKIYVSPSCQTANRYAYGNTTEAIQCRKIAKKVVIALERCGFAAMTNVTDDMDERMAESNAWGADLHVPIHTNALYGKSMGTQIFYNGGGISSRAARAIMDVLAPLTPGSGSDSVRANKKLYEIRNSNSPTAYIEVAFHDNKTEAKWIVNNTDKIAEAICKGICKTYGVTYVAP